MREYEKTDLDFLTEVSSAVNRIGKEVDLEKGHELESDFRLVYSLIDKYRNADDKLIQILGKCDWYLQDRDKHKDREASDN